MKVVRRTLHLTLCREPAVEIEVATGAIESFYWDDYHKQTKLRTISGNELRVRERLHGNSDGSIVVRDGES